jgi:hypothetical protein
MGPARRWCVPGAVAALAAAWIAERGPGGGAAGAGDAKAELREGLRDFDLAPGWIYDDVDAGFARAAKEGKPVCVVFR